MPRASLIHRVVPPIWMLIAIVSGLMVHYFHPNARVFDISYPPVSTLVALALLALGQVLLLRASYLFAKEQTEILPASEANRALLTMGPYRYTRNPMYLGLVVSVLAIAIYIGTLPLFVSAVALFCLLNFIFIPFEEQKMRHQFGDAFEIYTKQVRRWF